MQIHELTELSDVSTLNNNHVLAIDTGTVTRKIKYNNIAKATIENYNGSTIGGKAQTVKSAINAIATTLDGAEVRKAFSGRAITAHDTSDDGIDSFRLYGKCVQDGTPTPANPVAIATAGSAGNIVLRSTNGNLFNPAYLLGASGWTEQNGVYSGDALALFNRFQAAAWVPDTPAGTPLTISGRAIVSTSIQSPRFVFQYSDGSLQNVNITTGSSFATFSGTSDPGKIIGRITFTYSSGEGTVSLTGLRISIGAEPVTLDYVAPITVTLPTEPNGLPGIPVTSGGNYTDTDGQQWICDTIDKATGVYTQRATTILMDGSSTPNTIQTVGSYTRFWYQLVSSGDGLRASRGTLCSHLPYDGSGYDEARDGFGMDSSYSRAIWIKLPTSLVGSTAQSIQTWMQANNMTLVGALRTPVTTALTSAQITALNALRSFDGSTTVYTTDALEPEFTVKPFVNIGKYL